MPIPELIAGPYLPPPCRVGDWIDDEIDGRLEVGGWTTAPISWPRRKKTGKASLILTEELARAVRTESSEAISFWWGVSTAKVWMWRKALGVGRVTEGTRKLLQERTGVPPEAAARGRAAAAAPEVVARMAETKRGRPASPQTREALLLAAKAKKPTGWGIKANAWMLGRELPALHYGPWSDEEDSKLRELANRKASDIAALLGRTVAAVRNRLVHLGLAATRDASKGRRLGGKPSWTDEEDKTLKSLYGTMPNLEVAQRIGRTRQAVWKRANQLGLTVRRTTRAT